MYSNLLEIHLIISIIVMVIGFITELRMFLNYIYHKTKSDAYQFLGIFFIASFTGFEFLVISNLYLSKFYPNTIEKYEVSMIHTFFAISIASALLGISIQILLMAWVLKTAGFEFHLETWKKILLIFFCIVIMYTVIFQSSIKNVDSLPVFIIDLPYLSLTAILIASWIILTSNAYEYFKFLRKTTTHVFGKARNNFTYSIYLTVSVVAYITGVVIRIHLGLNWVTIIIVDIIFIIAVIVWLLVSYTYGFGESIQCILHMDSIFISHYSGKLIYGKDFTNMDSGNQELVSSFLTAINIIAHEIRVEEVNIERLVLEDGSEIILSIGKYTRAIVIAKKYNQIFRDKLKLLISRLETEESINFEEWIGSNNKIYEKIENYITEIF